MDISDLVLPIAAISIVGATLFFGWMFYRRYYRAVPPNRALVLFGGAPRGQESSANSNVMVGAPRIVVAGGVFVPPWSRGSDSLSLSPIDAEVRVLVAGPEEASGTAWELRLATQVKVPAEPRMLSKAAENLLGRSEPEVRALVVRTIEAVAPAVIRRELSGEARGDWDRLAAEIQAAVAPELVAIGLEVRMLSVTHLKLLSAQERSDSSALSTTSAPHLSRELLWASGDIGVRLRGVEVRLDRTERSLGLLGAEVMRLGRDTSQFPELPALQPYDSTGDEHSSRSSVRGSRDPASLGPGGATRPLLDAEG